MVNSNSRRALLPTFLFLALLAALVCTSCATADDRRERVLLVTTSTVEDSGLLDRLVASYHGFQDRYRLSTTAVGSGAALAIGARGDADILLTHDPQGEVRFMADGRGVDQGMFMVSEFVVAGPPEDPAGVAGGTDVPGALGRIAAAGAPFVSRSDDSGTHRREIRFWERLGRSPTPQEARPSWYVEAGSGMAEALRLADERGAYVLTDLATLRHLGDRLRLEVLVRGDPAEVNPYAYTLPRDSQNPKGAEDFRDWLIGPGQELIGAYGMERFGTPLFLPGAPVAATAGVL